MTPFSPSGFMPCIGLLGFLYADRGIVFPGDEASIHLTLPRHGRQNFKYTTCEERLWIL
jgi:hypothetical protein